MNTANIDNSIGADITRTITWQFDKATHLVGIINALRDFYDQSTKDLWDGVIGSVENIDKANDYGLSVWGKILNVRRTIVEIAPPESDANIFYTKYTGILNRINERFTKYPASPGTQFYFNNENFELVPQVTTEPGMLTWKLWRADDTEHTTSTYIAIQENIPEDSQTIDFIGGFRIDGQFVPPEMIDGGTSFTHEYTSGVFGPIPSDTYRKILKGRFALMNGNAELGIVGNASMSDYVKYVNYIFDGKVSVTEGPSYSTPEAMSMTFVDNGLDGELLDLFTNHKDIAFLYPCGVHDNNKSSSLRFGLDPSHTTHRSDRGGLGESSFTWN